MNVTRRQFVGGVAGTIALGTAGVAYAEDAFAMVAKVDRERILKAANEYLTEAPVTVTASHSERSGGGLHDYFSQGDYWWADPKSPGGPWIRRDGYTNPDNFNAHREALIGFGVKAPALKLRHGA